MKSLFRGALILMLGAFMIQTVLSVSYVAAQSDSIRQQGTLVTTSPTDIPVLTATQVPGLLQSDALSFSAAGLKDTLLRGPYSSTGVSFSLPPNWRLTGNSELRLIISAFADNSTNPLQTSDQTLGATLDVTFNGKFVSTIVLESGTNREYKIKIPFDALEPTSVDGRYNLFISLDAGIDCDIAYHKTTVVVHSNSSLYLPHTDKTIPLDIGTLPWPIYQRNSLVPSEVAIVLPDAASSSEVRSALIASAGFARMTNGQQPIPLFTTGQITDVIKNNYFLIFVGKPSSFGLLRGYPWPVGVSSDNKFFTTDANEDDGVLQIITSPWNSGRILIWISGNSDTAVVKAAQAFSSGAAKPVVQKNKIIVADTLPFANNSTEVSFLQNPDRTFTELGYKVETVTGEGLQAILYEFYIAPGFVANEDPYIDLSYSYSSLLDTTISNMTILVNGVQVASEAFEKQDVSLITKKFSIPRNLIRNGSNQISVEINLTPQQLCAVSDPNSLWVTIYPDSLLHVPLATAPIGPSAVQTFLDYPESFSFHPNLENVAFNLSKNDPSSWVVASNLSYYLGLQAKGNIINIAAYFDDEIPADTRGNYDWFFVGLPDTLPTLQEIRSTMPIPFISGNSLSTVQGNDIVYRVPEDVSLGYLELMPSPWGQDHVIIAVLGSTKEGLTWAGNGLITPSMRGSLFGNFAVVSSENLIAADTRTGSGVTEATTNLTPIVTPEAINPAIGYTPVGEPSTLEKLLTTKDYIPFSLVILIGLLLSILVWVIYSARRNISNNK